MAPDPQIVRHDKEKPPSKDVDVSPINLRLGLLVAASVALIFLAIIFMAALRGRGPGIMLRDPAASFDYSPIAGLMSHLGIFAMASAAGGQPDHAPTDGDHR